VGQAGWGHTGDFIIGNENAGIGGNVRLLIERGGNVGIGTTSPAYKLDIDSANPLRVGSDQTGDVSMRVGSNSTHRYLQLLNDGSASGLKVGGLLVADTYAHANPGRNDAVIKGTLKAGGYQSSDGTNGMTGTNSFYDDPINGGTWYLDIRNGLVTSITIL
jgi:hypothetical protein